MTSPKETKDSSAPPTGAEDEIIAIRGDSLDAALGAGSRLDVVIARLVEAVPSRSFAAKLIEKGFVRVDGKSCKPSFRVEPRHVVEVSLGFLAESAAGAAPPRAEDIPLDILYEDEHVLVLDKPAGLVVHPGAGVASGTLVNAVLAHCGATLPSLGAAARAGIVHRLDRDTSGVMVVAKSQLALSGLSRQFAAHTQDRRYLALCQGTPTPARALVSTWHGRDPRNRIRYAVVPEGQGKPARMEYEVKETYGNGNASLVECRLQTGRTHQIRVQLTHLGHPLLGDALYGRPLDPLLRRHSPWALIAKSVSRQMLHAKLLAFVHPASGERMEFTREPPADFAEALSLLRATNENPA
jgi:23S rRNA pseudouridine1911/1915/1917 synthase